MAFLMLPGMPLDPRRIHGCGGGGGNPDSWAGVVAAILWLLLGLGLLAVGVFFGAWEPVIGYSIFTVLMTIAIVLGVRA